MRVSSGPMGGDVCLSMIDARSPFGVQYLFESNKGPYASIHTIFN